MTQPSLSRDRALAFLKEHDLGALATLSPSGAPRVRIVYYACDESFSLYILSLAHTRKTEDLANDPRAAFTVASADATRTLQIEGSFEELSDTQTFGPILTELAGHLFPEDAAPAPITRMETGKPVIFKLTPTWIRWADFTRPSGEVFEEILP